VFYYKSAQGEFWRKVGRWICGGSSVEGTAASAALRRAAILNGRLLPRQKLPSAPDQLPNRSAFLAPLPPSYDRLQMKATLTLLWVWHLCCVNCPRFDAAKSHLFKRKSWLTPLSWYGATLTQGTLHAATRTSLPISFRYGRPALTEFPIKLTACCCRRCCTRIKLAGLRQMMVFRTVALRQAIITAVIARLQYQPRQIVINGTRQGLDTTVGRLLKPMTRWQLKILAI